MYAHRYQLRLIFGAIIAAVVLYALAGILVVRQ